MTVPEVASRFGVNAETVVGWEAGDRDVAMGRLEDLARLYRRPLAALFLPQPPDVPPMPHDFRVLPSEANRPLSKETLLVVREARRIQALARDLAKDLGRAPSSVIPPAEPTTAPEHLAARERERIGVTISEQRSWRTPWRALRAWREAMERLNVLVLQFGMPLGDARGFSLPDEVAPVIVLNSRDAQNARIFTLFHEYAHLLRGSSALCIPDPGAPDTHWGGNDEAFCNAFSGAFLAPAEPFKQALSGHRADDEKIAQLAQEFSVSEHVILHRLRALGLLSRVDLEAKLASLEARLTELPQRKKRGGPTAAQRCVGTRGRRFVKLVFEARTRDLITYRDVADFLSLRVQHFDAVEAMVGEG